MLDVETVTCNVCDAHICCNEGALTRAAKLNETIVLLLLEKGLSPDFLNSKAHCYLIPHDTFEDAGYTRRFCPLTLRFLTLSGRWCRCLRVC